MHRLRALDVQSSIEDIKPWEQEEDELIAYREAATMYGS